jgi:hypothetical protein
MASSYLTYKEPSYSDLIGGTPTNLLPKWLFNREYTPLPDVMAEAEKMAQIDLQGTKRQKEEQAVATAEEIFASPEVGPEKPLDVGLGQLEQELYKLGLVDNAQELTKRRQTEQSQAIQLQRIQEEMERQKRKDETPQYKKFGDMIYRVSPDGQLEPERPVLKSQKSDKQKAPPRPSQVLDDMLAQQVLDKMQREQAPQSAQAEGPGMLDQAGAWLSGMLNQPTVNPRARQVTPPLDAGAAISGDPRRRVITVRRKAIEQ